MGFTLVAAVGLVGALAFDLRDHSGAAATFIVVGTVLWLVALVLELRRGRAISAGARQREQAFYEARRNGASGPEAWISSSLCPTRAVPARDRLPADGRPDQWLLGDHSGSVGPH